jgi:ATP-dependent Clp protease ATP-binding subunit ClpC
MSAAEMNPHQFTDTTVALIADANRAAGQLGHEHMGIEHIVLAMTARDVDVVTEAFKRAGVDPAKVNQAMTGIVASGRAERPSELARPFSSRTQTSFAFAAESARTMGQPRIAPEHLLLGLLRDRTNIGAQVLADHGFTAERATEAIEQLLRAGG